MKYRLIPFISLSVAAAFAATPVFSTPRPASIAVFQDEKPPEKPAKPQDPKPPEKPGSPPAKPAPNHEPDRKPDNKSPEKPAKPEHKTPQQQNPPEKPAKPENAPKQQKQEKQQNDKMSRNSGGDRDQNKKSVHAQANVHYSFRSDEKPKIRQHFDVQIRSVDRSHRVHIREGGFIPAESVTVIQPVPVEVVELIPPVPEGCVVGFWDGYIIVYYPDDFYIVSYIDLL